MSTISIEDVIATILSGELDGQEDRIRAAMKSRSRVLLEDKVYTLKIGDTVRFNSHARPKYIQGLTATVLKLNQSSVVVQMKGEAGRFTGSTPRCPIAIVDKVEEES
jgi:hypothetical protein